RADAKGSGIIEIIHAQDAGEEARMVIEKIAALRSAAGSSWSWNDVAILVRANRQAEQFLPILNAAGIPYQFMASRGLYRKPIILDLLAYLELLDDHHESTALYRVLNFSVFGFTYDEILTLTNWAGRKAESLYAVLRNAAAVPGVTPETMKKVQRVLDCIAKHAEIARQKPVREVILAFFEDTDYLKDITKEESTEDHEAVGFLNQFWKRVEAFEESVASPMLPSFMEAMALEREAGEEGALPVDPNAGPEAVRVLTVHAAKGLEFRHVFVVNLIEQRFPSTDRSDPIELPTALTKVIIPEGDMHMAEERRLFYVALTRAKEGLYLSYADDYGGTRTRKPSRFLKEIGVDSGKLIVDGYRRSNDSPLSTLHSPLGNAVSAAPTHALPSKLSFTQLKAYQTCPWQYHYAHILRIPMRGRFVFSFGQTMHLTLQRFFETMRERSSTAQTTLFSPSHREGEREGVGKEENIPPLNDLLAFYEAAWIDDWYENATSKKEYFENGKRILKEFYAKHEREGWPNVLSTEQPFTVKFPVAGPGGSPTISVIGKADRIDRLPDGSVEIVDYKTGKARTKLEADDKMQLLIYQVAATQALGLTPKVLSYYYLETNEKREFIGTNDELEKLAATVADISTRIASGDFTATPGRHCQFCDFKKICPYAQT
ncbi:MAG: ATP-dependent DNA helicase, partial [Candidatus Peregrinibacteria bacterium]|nr:ATP-dependent DNA helicase [Candidatus Peregrinibacteria bacterium]